MTFSEYKNQLRAIYQPFNTLGCDIPLELADHLLNQADEMIVVGLKQGFHAYRAQEELLDETLGNLLEQGYLNPALAERILLHYPSLDFHLNYEPVKGQLNIALAEVGFKSRLRNIYEASASSLVSYVCAMPESPNPDYVLKKCIDSLRYLIDHEEDRGFFKFLNKDYIRDFYTKAFLVLPNCSPSMKDQFFLCMQDVVGMYEQDDLPIIVQPQDLIAWLTHDSVFTIAQHFSKVVMNHYAIDLPLSDVVVLSKISLPQGFWERPLDGMHPNTAAKLLTLGLCEYLEKPNSQANLNWLCEQLSLRISELIRRNENDGRNNEPLKVLYDYFQRHGVKSEGRVKDVVIALSKACERHSPMGLPLRVLNKLGLDDKHLIYSETSRHFLERDLDM